MESKYLTKINSLIGTGKRKVAVILIITILLSGLGIYYYSEKTIYLYVYHPHQTKSVITIDFGDNYVLLYSFEENESSPFHDTEKFTVNHFEFPIEITVGGSNSTNITTENFNIFSGRYIVINLSPVISFEQRRNKPEGE